MVPSDQRQQQQQPDLSKLLQLARHVKDEVDDRRRHEQLVHYVKSRRDEKKMLRNEIRAASD